MCFVRLPDTHGVGVDSHVLCSSPMLNVYGITRNWCQVPHRRELRKKHTNNKQFTGNEINALCFATLWYSNRRSRVYWFGERNRGFIVLYSIISHTLFVYFSHNFVAALLSRQSASSLACCGAAAWQVVSTPTIYTKPF